jgi:hypothetical protein
MHVAIVLYRFIHKMSQVGSSRTRHYGKLYVHGAHPPPIHAPLHEHPLWVYPEVHPGISSLQQVIEQTWISP